MQNTIPIIQWLDMLNKDYLSSFIREGGASVKFAVTPDALKISLSALMRERCKEEGYLLIELSAASRLGAAERQVDAFEAVGMRAHMPQDIFFGMARQIDWQGLARRAVLRLASQQGYVVDGINPDDDGNVFESVARANGLEQSFVMNLTRRQIQDYVFRNPNMAKDFRVAMTHLCLEGSEGSAPHAGHPLLDWLTGAATRIGSVRPFGIYTGINRTTARYFIESALFWIQYAGYAGTVILFDNSRVTLARNPRDGVRYYTRAMAVDHYELLREFVDGVDNLTNTLLVVSTSEDFQDEGSARGYSIYPALRTRVMNDVRDRNLANPIASLVRLS